MQFTGSWLAGAEGLIYSQALGQKKRLTEQFYDASVAFGLRDLPTVLSLTSCSSLDSGVGTGNLVVLMLSPVPSEEHQ